MLKTKTVARRNARGRRSEIVRIDFPIVTLNLSLFPFSVPWNSCLSYPIRVDEAIPTLGPDCGSCNCVDIWAGLDVPQEVPHRFAVGVSVIREGSLPRTDDIVDHDDAAGPNESLGLSEIHTGILFSTRVSKHLDYLRIIYLVRINKSKIERWFEGFYGFRSNSDDNCDLRGYSSSFKVLPCDLSSCQSIWFFSQCNAPNTPLHASRSILR